MSITRGMILAAGLGTRLLPVSKTIPKPLVPVLNVPNVLHTVFLLKRAGVSEILINLHHLPDPIRTYLGTGERWGVRFEYSFEPQLLGTGGGVKKAEPFFKGEPFVLANCDFVTDIDLRPYMQIHRDRGALATMVLLEDSKRQALYSPVGVSKEGTLCSLRDQRTAPPARTGIFTGLHVLSPEIFAFLRREPCGINDLLYPALMEKFPTKALGCFASDRSYWLDTGEFSNLHESTLRLLDLLSSSPHLGALLKATGHRESAPGIWLGEKTSVPKGVEVMAPVVVGHGVAVGLESVLGPSLVVGDGATLGEKTLASRSIVLSTSGVEKGRVFGNGIYFDGARVWGTP